MEQYETHYGVQLLDDLHNYFPALLYDSRRFINVQDVLQYIITATQNRFNLFQRGQQSYRLNQLPHDTPTTTPNNPPMNIVTETIDITPLFTTNLNSVMNPLLNSLHVNTNTNSNTNTATATATIPQVNRQQTTVTRPQVSQNYTYSIPLTRNHTIPRIPLSYYQTEFPNVERSMTNEMSGLYDDIYSTIRNLIRTDLEPVVVHPTQEQIDSATTLTMVDRHDEESEGEGEDELCSICQDGYVDGQAMRKINHCSHSFHKSCIDEWFERNVHCPICRYDIRDDTNSE
jgi:hypothetical protein